MMLLFSLFFKISTQQQPILSFNDQSSHHIETSQLICSANQLTGFYMMGTLVVKRSNSDSAFQWKMNLNPDLNKQAKINNF